MDATSASGASLPGGGVEVAAARPRARRRARRACAGNSLPRAAKRPSRSQNSARCGTPCARARARRRAGRRRSAPDRPTSRGADAAPQHRRHLVPDEAVEDAPALLRLDQLHVELAPVRDRVVDRLAGDLVEHHALDRHLGPEHLDEVPRDGLALAVLVGREVELVGALQRAPQLGDDVLLAPRGRRTRAGSGRRRRRRAGALRVVTFWALLRSAAGRGRGRRSASTVKSRRGSPRWCRPWSSTRRSRGIWARGGPRAGGRIGAPQCGRRSAWEGVSASDSDAADVPLSTRGRCQERPGPAVYPAPSCTVLSTHCSALSLDPKEILDDLSPYGTIGLMLIIFAESGLLIGFFLPGDSLLFTGRAPRVAGQAEPRGGRSSAASSPRSSATRSGYTIGKQAGPRLFRRPNSRLFKQKYVDRAKDFFDEHGAEDDRPGALRAGRAHLRADPRRRRHDDVPHVPHLQRRSAGSCGPSA